MQPEMKIFTLGILSFALMFSPLWLLFEFLGLFTVLTIFLFAAPFIAGVTLLQLLWQLRTSEQQVFTQRVAIGCILALATLVETLVLVLRSM